MAGPVPAISIERARHFNTRFAWRRALSIEITGTSPVMTVFGCVDLVGACSSTRSNAIELLRERGWEGLAAN
jgi:hypothetical protein